MIVHSIVNRFQEIGPQVGMPATFVQFGPGRDMTPEEIANSIVFGLQRVVLYFPSMIDNVDELVHLCSLIVERRKFVILNVLCNRFTPELIPYVRLWRLEIPMLGNVDRIVNDYITHVHRDRLSFEIYVLHNLDDIRSMVARLGLSAVDLSLYRFPGSPFSYGDLASEVINDRFWMSMQNLRILDTNHGKSNSGLLTRGEAITDGRANTDADVGNKSA